MTHVAFCGKAVQGGLMLPKNRLIEFVPGKDLARENTDRYCFKEQVEWNVWKVVDWN